MKELWIFFLITFRWCSYFILIVETNIETLKFKLQSVLNMYKMGVCRWDTKPVSFRFF